MTVNTADAGQIDLQITGFANDAGTARILLFKGQAGYHGEIDAERIASVSIRDGKTSAFQADDLDFL